MCWSGSTLVLWLFLFIAGNGILSHNTPWVKQCASHFRDRGSSNVDMTQSCMKDFYAHYTTAPRHHTSGPTDAACLAQAWIYRNQFCGRCGSNHTIGVGESGHAVPAGLGSRWEFIGHEIARGIAQRRTLRVWDPRQSVVSCAHLKSPDCAWGSERCYFRATDQCPQPESASDADKPENMATWHTRRPALHRADLPEPLKYMTSLWLSSQLLFFVLQPLPHVHEWVHEFWRPGSPTRIDVPRPGPSAPAGVPPDQYIAMHVRWSPKCSLQERPEAPRDTGCAPVSKYLQAAAVFRERYGVRRILLSSDSPEALEPAMQGQYPDWAFHVSNASTTGPGSAARLAGAEAQRKITAFLTAAHADYLICAASDSWCRAVFRYVMALRGQAVPHIFIGRWGPDTFSVFPDDVPTENSELLSRMKSQRMALLPFSPERPRIRRLVRGV